MPPEAANKHTLHEAVLGAAGLVAVAAPLAGSVDRAAAGPLELAVVDQG